jgi:hypothetical protein
MPNQDRITALAAEAQIALSASKRLEGAPTSDVSQEELLRMQVLTIRGVGLALLALVEASQETK